MLAVAGAAAGFGTRALLHDGRGSAASGAVRVSSALVVRTSLTSTTQVSGSIGYHGSYTVFDQTQGTAFTALPGTGTTIRRGMRLYEVDGSPVILFYGRRPEWRTLSAGVAMRAVRRVELKRAGRS